MTKRLQTAHKNRLSIYKGLSVRASPALYRSNQRRNKFTDVRIYDRDRTICDVLRNMNKMDKEIFNKAIQGYVNDPQKNVPNLIEYAKTMRVWNKVKNLIGVWL